MPGHPGDDVSIVYTGLTGGLTHARTDFAPLWTMFDTSLSPPFRAGGFREDNVFRHGDRLLYTDQGPLTLRDLERFLEGGACTFGPPEPVPLVLTDDALVVELGSAGWGLPAFGDLVARAGRFHTTQGRRARRHRIVNGAGTTLFLVDSAGAPLDPCAPLAAVEEWEMVPAASVDLTQLAPDGSRRGSRLLAAARPLGQGLRRSLLVQRWRAATPGRALYVDLGDALEPGGSEGAVVRRGFTMAHLGELGLDGLVPGETELGLARAEWARLAATVPLLAANVEPLDAAEPRPAPALTRLLGKVRVAVVGLADDRTFEAAGLAGAGARWKVGDPVAVAVRELARLRELPLATRPELTVIATNIRDDRLQLLRQLDGAAAVLADMDGLPGELVEETVSVSGEARARGRKPLLVVRSSPSRVGRLTAHFSPDTGEGRNLLRLRNEAQLVTDKLPQEARWRHELNVLADAHQRKRRELLLPDLREVEVAGERLADRFDTGRWNTLVTQVMWSQTGAEVTVLRRIPLDYKVIGPVSRLAAERWLEVEDRLVDVVLPGKAIKALAATGQGLLSFAGYDAGAGQVLGGPIGDEELYRVTTTDLTMRLPRLREHFEGRPTRDRWATTPEGFWRSEATGAPVTLRDQVVDSLRALKQRHGGAFDSAYREDLLAWLAPRPAAGPPRWSVRLDDGELLTNALRGAEDPAFAQVRNTRATAPSTLTVGGRGRVAVLYDSRDWGLEQRARGIYKRNTLTREGTEVVQETDDELALTSEVRLKRLAAQLPVGTLTPFGSGTYTTEFVPDVSDGGPKPRRSELAAIAGLLWAPGGPDRDWRLGFALKNDLANPGMLEPGFYVAGGFERSLAPLLPARFKSGVEVFRFAATPTDTPDRLGLAATLNAGLAIPLWDRLTLNVGADWFVFSGKVPDTDRLRASADFRVGLGYSLTWKPLHRIWF